MKRKKQRIYQRGEDHLCGKKIFSFLITRGVILFFLFGSVAFFGKKFYNYLNNKIFVSFPLFRINQIEVNSGDIYLNKKLNNFLNEYKGKSILFSLAKLKKEIIALFPEIREVKIKERLGGKVIVFLTKREPVALIEEVNSQQSTVAEINNFYEVIDQESKIFPLSFAGKLPLVSKEEKNLKKVVNFLGWLKKENVSLYQRIKKIYTSEKDNFVFVLNTGEKIIWGKEIRSEHLNSLGETKEIVLAKEKLQHLLLVLSDLTKRMKSNPSVNSGLMNRSPWKGKMKVIDLSFYPEGGIVVRTKETVSTRSRHLKK